MIVKTDIIENKKKFRFTKYSIILITKDFNVLKPFKKKKADNSE
jgi:hypothetical protein